MRHCQLGSGANDQAKKLDCIGETPLISISTRGRSLNSRSGRSAANIAAECYFGLTGAYVIGTLAAADQGPLVHACFMMDGSGTVTIHTDDNGGADNNASQPALPV